MLDVSIKTIPQDKQRYNTKGDYWRDKHRINIRVSDLKNKDYEFLVACHELTELYLCDKRGIIWEDIDKFDIRYEKNRKDKDGEPGDHPQAPYRKEHRFAENIERLVCHELGIDWNVYNDTLNKI